MEILENTVEIKKEQVAAESIAETYERLFPAVARFVCSMNGSLDDAKDIFHDALVIYFETAAHKDNPVHTSEEGYILGIAKHLWIRKYWRDKHKISLDDVENSISIPDDYFSTPSNTRLLTVLERAGKKCMDLLREFYFRSQTIKKLARTLGYANEHSASVQKYKCLQKVKNLVKTKELAYDDFME
jgi:DNA-directed RNA polymerase specialized sigma24 family protein